MDPDGPGQRDIKTNSCAWRMIDILQVSEAVLGIVALLAAGISSIAVWVNRISGRILVLETNIRLIREIQDERLGHMSQRLDQIHADNKRIFDALDELKATVYQMRI